MTNKFDLLVSLDKIHVISVPVASSVNVTLKPGMFVSIVNGEAVLPPSEGYAPIYLVLSDMDEPITKYAGKIGVAFGDMRIETEMYETDTYAAGDALTVSKNGLLKKHADVGAIIGYVESVVDNKLIVVLK